MHEVIVVGAGPAGLSAALVLGRCRRRVLLCDSDRPRNYASRAVHMFLTRDGINPRELRRLGREELRRYPSVEFLHCEVTDAARCDEGFEIVLSDGSRFRSRLLLLATGLIDKLPPIENIERFYGLGVYHCPYCDGWEVRDEPLAAYGQGKAAFEYALELRAWSERVALLSDGDAKLSRARLAHLRRQGVQVRTDTLWRLEGSERLERVRFRSGEAAACRGFFFSPSQAQRSPIAERLGCRLEEAMVRVGTQQVTSIPGLFAAGDAAWRVQAAIVAAAEGARAGMAINACLLKRDLKF